MRNPVNIGVSIESGQVAAVLLKETLFGQKLLDCDRRGFKGESSATQQIDIVNDLLKKLLERNRIQKATLSLALPEDMIVFRQIRVPTALKENLKGALYYELNKHLPVLPEEVYFDCRIIAEDRENAMINVLLVVIKKKLLEPFLHIGADFHVTLTRVDLASTATGAFFRQMQSVGKANFLFLIHPIENQLVFTVFEKGRLRYMSRAASGAKAGSPDESLGKHISQIIDEVKTAFGPMAAAVYPAAMLSDQVFDMLSDSDMDLVSVDVQGSDLPEEQYVTAFGAALDPYAAGVETLNLLPESLQKKPSRLGYYAVFFLAGVLAVCASIYGGSLIYQKKQAIDRLNMKIESFQQQIAEAGQIQGKYDKMAGRLKYLNDFGGNAQLIEMLRELSTILPQDSWLNEFRLTGNEIRIDGFSDSAAKLIGLIENSPLFDNARFLSTIRKSQGSKERFQIGMEVERNG